MKKLIYILPLFLLLACQVDEPAQNPVATDGPKALVAFTLTLGDESVAATQPSRSAATSCSGTAGTQSSRATVSRTPSDGPYDPGTEIENLIDIENRDFRFIFYTGTDNRLVGELTVQSVIPTYDSPQYKRYSIQGLVPAAVAEAATHGVKLCVLANWKQYPSLTPGDDIARLWESDEAVKEYADFDGMPGEGQYIPLYGIRRLPAMELDDRLITELGTVQLLRAYAKIDVTLDATVIPVKSVTLTRINSQALKAPRNILSQEDYVHGSYPLDYIPAPSIPASTSVIENIPLHEVTPDVPGQRQYRIYVPEYLNSAAGRTEITVNYQEESIPAGHIQLRDYRQSPGSLTSSSYYDILRNNWYRFSCTMTSHAELDIKLDVQPWAAVDLLAKMGLERDENGDIIVRNSKGEIIKIIQPQGSTLDFKPVELPGVGDCMGVFDGDRVLIVSRPEGMRYYNYHDVDSTGNLTLTSIEQYADEPERLDQEVEYYILDRDKMKWEQKTIHNIYCEGGHGHLIEQYTYGTKQDYDNEVAGVVRTVRYTKNEGGYVTIIYTRASDGKDYMKIVVDLDGTETYYPL